MKNLLVLFVAMCLLSCSSDDDNTDTIKIRLSNSSAYDYKNIVVNTSSGNVSYGDLDSGKMSEYKNFELAYRYAFVELLIDGETFTIQPIDYTGESPLENGEYTYQINADDSQDQFSRLSLTLLAD